MSASPRPLVSIVTPVHNGERHLAECIESVRAQTYPEWEYTIVDNFSGDGTADIARRYAELDPRIRVVRNPALLPMVDNWNHALRQISAESRYCKVLHADDWMYPECLERMVELAEAHPSVGVVAAYRLCNERVDLDGLPYSTRVVSGRDVCRRTLLGGPYLFGSPSSLLLRADLVRARPSFYTPLSSLIDVDACYKVLRDSDFGFVHQVLTFTRIGRESVTIRLRREGFGREVAENLHLLRAHGPVYLTEEELEARWQQVIGEYYQFLVRNLFALREREFWAYHAGQLRAMGHPLSPARLAAGAARKILSVALRPATIVASQARAAVSRGGRA